MRAGKDIIWKMTLAGAALLAFLFAGFTVSAAEPVKEVHLDLSGNTLQFGGFPGQRDREALIEGICPERNRFGEAIKTEETWSPEAIRIEKERALEDLYELIDTSICREIPGIDVSAYGLTMDAAVEIVSDVLNGNPTYFFIEDVSVELDPLTQTVRSIKLIYDDDHKKEEYEAAVNKILNQIDPAWNDEEKLFYLHDYLVTHCQYDLGYYTDSIEETSYRPYGVIVLHKAVCQGYAEAFSDLANRVGVNVDLVSSDGLNHAWNLVTLGENRYYVDVTWDDPTTTDATGAHAHKFDRFCRHSNFLLSEAGITRTGHDTTDWFVNGELVYGLYTDTRYDCAAWRAADSSPVICDKDGILYYGARKIKIEEGKWSLGEKDHVIYRYHCDGSVPESLFTFDYETSFPDRKDPSVRRYWDAPTLTGTVDCLLLNDRETIYRIDLLSNTRIPVYTLSDAEKDKGVLYGTELTGTSLNYDIGVSNTDGDKTASGVCDLSLLVTAVSLDQDILSLRGLEDPQTLTPTVTGKDAGGVVTWTSSNPEVVVVQDGTVTPVGYGMAYITAQAGIGLARCRVNVDTTWQEAYDYSVYIRDPYDHPIYPQFDGVIHLKAYNGPETSITIPAETAVVSGVSCVTAVDLADKELEEVSFAPGILLQSLSFYMMKALKKVDLSNVDTSRFESMQAMFYCCEALTELDLSGFDTSHVTDMSYMFCECSALTKLDLSGFDTSHVTDMSYMFDCCRALTDLNLSGFRTGQVTTFKNMFSGCTFLKALDLSAWVFSGEADVTGFLPEVSRMNEIKTPVNLKVDIALPTTGKFVDTEGNTYTSLPKERAESILLNRYLPVTGIFLQKRKLTLDPGDEEKLTLIYTPEDATNTETAVRWESSAPSVATVDDTGTVHGVKAGSATITAILIDDESNQDPCFVTVNYIPPERIEIREKDPEIEVISTLQLTWNVFPEKASLNTISFTSSRPDVAEVDENGLVKGISTGTATITMDADGLIATTNVTVQEKVIPMQALALQEPETGLVMWQGESRTFTAVKTPADATAKLTWESSDPSVVSIRQDGSASALSKGDAIITVSGGGFTASCHVTVEVALTRVSLSEEQRVLRVGEELSVRAQIDPLGAEASVEWKADDNGSLVSLVPSEDGKELLIKTLASGIVHVTATATDARREKPIVLSASVTIVIIDEEQPDPGALKLDPTGNFTVEGLKESYEYTGYPVIPDIRVYYGNRRLVMKKEYTITCSNNKRTGTATLVIKGKGNFTGKSQAISYRIDAAQTGALSIKKAVITGLDKSYPYTGQPVVAPGLSVTLAGKTLEEGSDYIVSYSSHLDAGTATVVITGIGEYRDSVKKTFKITPVNLRQSENALQILLADTPFAAGGARPEPIVTWTVAGRTLLLKSGVDYRLGYKNNKTLGSASLILTGQGNFTGKVTRPFMVTRGDLGELTLCAPDVLYKPDQKGTYYQSKVKLYDTDGKLLKLNTDYRLIFIDVTQEDMQLVKNLPKNLVKPEDEIIVQVWPGSSGRYEGDASTSYFIRQQMKDIGKPKAFKIPDQIYTGEPVMPVVRLDGLTEGEDYEMIGCFNNVERGSATVLLKGINAYSGNRTVRFRIVQRPLTSS